ncbi:MAG: AbrB/MazE/SpoVT family DNA-binding domain-containing protein [Thaumarchaeota archaeon]|nr:MAG: AbrB/MazE/SpoVT family DNA-binding domain-containing protein [Nitrososphaerota archaeon]
MNTELSEDVVVGKRYTVVIPKSIRKKLKIEEGERVSIKVRGNEIVMEPLAKDPYATLARLIGEQYDEGRDERRAEELLKKLAGG